MMKVNIIWIAAFIGIVMNTWMLSDGANILFFTPMGTKSHKIFFMGVTHALAKRGHHVTMVSAYKGSKDTENITEVVIPESDIGEMLVDIFDKGGANSHIKDMIFESPRLCVNALGQKKVQDLKKEKFDLVIMSMFFDYCFLSFVHHFKVPLIYALPAGIYSTFSEIVGNVELSSLVPNKLLEATFPQTFQQRFMTVVLNSLLTMVTMNYMSPKMQNVCRENGLCPPDMPTFEEISNNVSLVIINSVKALEWPPRPMMPNIIHAGGAHIGPAKNLSQDLESWVESSGKEGFIFFSLGSGVTPSTMPEKYRKILINVFGSLKQKVLWKWDEEFMPDLPKNVKLGKWLPQQDILGHPKIKLFITHGGLLSAQESNYHGVPIIGMPIFADQFHNINEAVIEGWAKMVQWDTLTESSLRETILETIQDKKLKEVSVHRASLMRDRPMEPADEAAFWVEYVIRHKGASHLKSPVVGMPWYVLYNVDIWAIIVGVVLAFIYLSFKIFKYVLYLIFKSKNNKKNKKE